MRGAGEAPQGKHVRIEKNGPTRKRVLSDWSRGWRRAGDPTTPQIGALLCYSVVHVRDPVAPDSRAVAARMSFASEQRGTLNTLSFRKYLSELKLISASTQCAWTPS